MVFQSESVNNNTLSSMLTDTVEALVKAIDDIPYDRDSIPQENLDLANKFRSSLLPWRGQFSPELVEIFLNAYSETTDIIFDPFVGSGTTLFEAARRGLRGYGAEINPAAVEMSKTAQFATFTPKERKAIIGDTEKLVKKYFRPLTQDLFSYLEQQQDIFLESIDNPLFALLQDTANDVYSYNIIANAIIRYMSYKEPRSHIDFTRAFQEHIRIIENMPYSSNECTVFHVDARSVPLPEKHVDFIVSSPPYINVFNYHQNNRQAMEMLGWNVLEMARSEIGANRKNRGNRFLTVIQYALDMLDVLKEMHRILKSDGRATIVVGRESTVRGISFENGLIVALLAVGGAGFKLERRQERKFRNKFGELIYEDILHFLPSCHPHQTSDAFAREVALWCLKNALSCEGDAVKKEIFAAIENTATVSKSPLFDGETNRYREAAWPEKMRHLEIREKGVQ